MGRVPEIRFTAFALAMQARAGTLSRDDAAALLVRAARELAPDDPDYLAVRAFCDVTARRGARPEAVADAGAELIAAIDRLNVPVPPDVTAGRADIHG